MERRSEDVGHCAEHKGRQRDVPSRDLRLTRLGSKEIADLVRSELVGVDVENSGVARNDVRAVAEHVDPLELVLHQGSEPVVQWIKITATEGRVCVVSGVLLFLCCAGDVLEPEKPPLHREDGDHIACVDDHNGDQDRRESGGDVVRLSHGSDQPEEGGHDQEREVDEEEEPDEQGRRESVAVTTSDVERQVTYVKKAPALLSSAAMK